MRFKSICQSYFAIVFILFSGSWVQGSVSTEQGRRELSIAEALKLAERTSPGLKASVARESQSKANLKIAQSSLYPSFYLDAVDAFGFPGSKVPTPPQFGGLMSSPFAVGPVVGVLGKVTLLDLGSWYSIDASRERTYSSEAESKVRRLQLDQTILQTYFDAARFRGQIEIWKNIETKTEAVLKTVKTFVKNGQYSEVQLLLIQDQTDEANMKVASFQEHYQQAMKRLALLTSLNENEIACPTPLSLSQGAFHFTQPTQVSPLVTRAEVEVKVAHAQASQASSEHLPKVYALGSIGWMSDVRLVNPGNYSLWVGMTLPLFEGFRVSSEVQRVGAIVDEKENTLLETKLELDELNVRYDEQINVSLLEMKFLERQHHAALRTFDVTKKRYLSFLEPVINLRESIRNLARIETQMNEVQANLLLAIGSKAVLNGGGVE